MKFDLIELTDKKELQNIYDIYKACMYCPTEEKFSKKADNFLNDCTTKIFVCSFKEKLVGVIVISFLEQNKIEIIGIAVDTNSRCKGVGSFMIDQVVNKYGLISVFAETDNNAVGFYRKCGFNVTEFTEKYDDETVVRYKCELRK